MKWMRTNRIVMYFLMLNAFVLVAESCASSKSCGCGNDLNKVYKQPKRFH